MSKRKCDPSIIGSQFLVKEKQTEQVCVVETLLSLRQGVTNELLIKKIGKQGEKESEWENECEKILPSDSKDSLRFSHLALLDWWRDEFFFFFSFFFPFYSTTEREKEKVFLSGIQSFVYRKKGRRKYFWFIILPRNWLEFEVLSSRITLEFFLRHFSLIFGTRIFLKCCFFLPHRVRK